MMYWNTACASTWVEILTALLTPTIAFLAVFIAWQQWRTNRNKLKMELFDRRYEYYEAARELIGHVLSSGGASDRTTFEFLRRTRGAKFIVGEKIGTYFDKQLYSKALDLNCLQEELQGVGVGEVRSTNVKKQSDIRGWFKVQNDSLDELFDSQLNLQH